MKKVTQIRCAMPTIVRKKKVAAYARISMETERMNHSLSAQISYYNGLIQRNPEWEFAGVYADDGISGTTIGKREGFKKMIADCDAGKIDIILTKSIQRFARNTVDLLNTVRYLKDLGIEVQFEKERIHSLTGDGELMLSILASFAQEESRSISENIKWGTRKRFQQGIPNGRFQIYGYRWEGDHLVIVPEEATVVKRIFQNFLDGKSRLETEREFAAEGITTRSGCRWQDSNIKVVLTNITYTGNLLLQKEYIEDPIGKKPKKNHGELPQYYVENNHEAIIDKTIFDYVQREMARRKELGPFANKSLNTTCFTGKIKCGICGRSFMHNLRKDRGFQEFWDCGSHKLAGRSCGAKGSILQAVLIRECTTVLGLNNFDENVFLDRVDKIVVPKHHMMVFHMKDGREITRHWISTAKKDCWTDEYKDEQRAWMRNYMANGTNTRYYPFTTRIKCALCGSSFRRYSKSIKSGTFAHWRCTKGGQCESVSLREEDLERMAAEAMGTRTFDGDRFRKEVEWIAVGEKDKVVIHFKDGRVKEIPYTPPKKRGIRHTAEYKKNMSRIKKQYRERKRKESEDN